jgi:NAD kinase
MATLAPRIVFVSRQSEYQLLLARHATREQARFFLEKRGQSLDSLALRHQQFRAALDQVQAAVPPDWRRTLVERDSLDRFLFTPEDIVVAVGQDGLVANLAKYLTGQPVIGINPAPDLYDGVLAQHAANHLPALLKAVHHKACRIERRTMVQASLDSGQTLTALNEIFVGHQSHQSARYRLADGDCAEEQSSSGLIIASGTGTTGWARSIMEASGTHIALGIEEQALGWFVREPFPSRATGTAMRAGKLNSRPLEIMSRMNAGGVVFADGIEQDHLDFGWGSRLTISVAQQQLLLVKEGGSA